MSVYAQVSELPNSTTEVSDTANATTTSSTDALLTTMTISPVAGNYLLMFTTSITSSAAGAAISCSVYVGGTQQAKTLMKIAPFDGGTLSATTARGSMAITSTVSVTSGQTVEIHWSTSAGTATCGPRIMNLLRLQ